MTDFYIAKAGETHDGQKYANVSLAPDGKTYEQGRFLQETYRFACTYNSPKDAFDTIIYRQLNSVSVGDIITLKIYKGYVPDLTGVDQPTLTDSVLDEANLMASKSVTATATTATDYVFKFDQEFSDSNLTSQLAGDAPQFTVVQSLTDSSGTALTAHRTLFAVRTVVPEIFTFPTDFPSTSSADGGAGNSHFLLPDGSVSHSGSAADRPLALEFLKSTDIPLGNDSNDGLSLSTPKATVASVQAIRAFTPADKIVFRAGTYTTELAYGPDSSVLMEFDTLVELISLEAYEDEIVIFEMPVTKSYLVNFANISGLTDTDLYSVRNIQFRNGVGNATTAFMLFTQSSSSTKIIEFVLEGCTFTQLASEADLTHGALYASNTLRGTVRVKNNTFNIADARALNLTNQALVIVEGNTFNLNAPSSNDSSNAMFYLTGRSNPVMTTKVFIQNNTTTYNWAGNSGNNILHQLEYFHEMYFHSNDITINSTNINSSVFLDTIRPATSLTNGRTTTLIDIVGNTFTHNGGLGDTIEFYRAAGQTDYTHVVNLNYNHFIGNAVLQNKTGTECFNTKYMYASEFNCIGNTFEKYQDFLLLDDMQNTPYLVEDNIFKNGGNNNTGAGGDAIPLSIYVIESISGAIKNNTFFIEEEGTCIRLHSGVTNDVEVTGNSFVYLGDTRTDGEEYVVLNINANDLDEVFIDNNYYYGLEKLGDTTLFAYAPTATFDEAMAIADTDVTFHTTNIIKRDIAKSMTSRLTKDIAWKV